jgi:hypothetical protein
VLPDMLFGLITDAVGWILAALPQLHAPSWMAPGGSVVTAAASLGSDAAGFSAWFPFGALGTVVDAVLLAIPIAIAVRLARALMSLMTGGGGN